MFELSWSHILLIVVVALVVVGPKDLPKLMRTAGQWMGKARRMADQFRKSFDDMAREAELDELRAEIDSLRHQRPLGDIGHELSQPILPAEYLPKPEAAEAVTAPQAAPSEKAATPSQ